MCRYEDIEGWTLSNDKSIREINIRIHEEVEKIYLDSWSKGIAVPYFDEKGNIFLANPDGSDAVAFDSKTREYKILKRIAAPGEGKMSYLLRNTPKIHSNR